jgi:hypothetical protein
MVTSRTASTNHTKSLSVNLINKRIDQAQNKLASGKCSAAEKRMLRARISKFYSELNDRD